MANAPLKPKAGLNGPPAKKVGKGTESMAKEGAEKVGGGLSSVGNKIDNKAKGTNDKQSNQSNKQNPE